MFINYSNHESSGWSEAQLFAAKEYGTLCDVPFPDVSVESTKEDILKLAEAQIGLLEETARVAGTTLNETAIMCQGEFSLSYAVISRLKRRYPGCRVLCAVSKRNVVETKIGDTTEKRVIFSFCGFREYI